MNIGYLEVLIGGDSTGLVSALDAGDRKVRQSASVAESAGKSYQGLAKATQDLQQQADRLANSRPGETIDAMGNASATATSKVDALGGVVSEASAKAAAAEANFSKLLAAAKLPGLNNAPLQETSDELDEVAEAAEKAERRMKQLDSAASSLQRMGAGLTAGLTLPIVALGGGLVKSAVEMENLRRSLVSVTGSTEAAEKQLAELREVAKQPGLGFQEAVQGSVRLQAAGFSAEMATRQLKAYGTALAEVGLGRQELEGVILALTQMQGAGKVTGEELNQLAEKIPRIRSIVREVFGTSDPQQLEKMGVSVEEFSTKVVAQMEKLNKPVAGAKETFEDLSDTVFLSMAKVGSSILPAVTAVTKMVTPMVEGLADGFSKLPPGMQQTIVGLLGITAVLGPLLLGLGTLGKVILETRVAYMTLTAIGPAVLGMLTGTTAATAAQTGVIGLNTLAVGGSSTASGVNLLALEAAIVARGRATTALTANTGAFGINTTAVGTNTGALGANALAAGGRVGAMGMIGNGLAAVGRAVPTAAAAAAVGYIAYKGTEELVTKPFVLPAVERWGDSKFEELNDHAVGIQNRNLATRRAKPLFERKAVASHIDRMMREQGITREQAQEQFTKTTESLEKNGKAPDFAPLAVDAKKQAEDAQEKARQWEMFAQAREMEYQAMLQQAKAKASGGDKETRALREAQAVIPLMEARYKDLSSRAEEVKAKGMTTAEEQEKYWGLVKEASELQERIGGLRERAQDEELRLAKQKKEAALKSARREREMRVQQYDTMISMQKAFAGEGSGDANVEQIRESAMMIPALLAKQQEVVKVAKEVAKLAPGDEELTKEYHSLQQEYWDIQNQVNSLHQKAQQAEQRMAKEAADKKLKINKEILGIYKDSAMARVAQAPEGTTARSSLQNMLPILQGEQAQILAEASQLQPGTLEYFQAVRQYASVERQIQELTRNANKERGSELKKATDEAKKSAKEAQDLQSAHLRLQEAQVQNNPFLNPRQRASALLQVNLRKLAALSRPVEGETELDRVNREIEIQNLGGSTLRNALELQGANMSGQGRRGRRGLQNFRGIRGAFAGAAGYGLSASNPRAIIEQINQAISLGRGSDPLQGDIPFPNQAAPVAGNIPDPAAITSQYDPRYTMKAREVEQRNYNYQYHQWASKQAQSAAGGGVTIFQAVIDPYANGEARRQEFWNLYNEMERQIDGGVTPYGGG